MKVEKDLNIYKILQQTGASLDIENYVVEDQKKILDIMENFYKLCDAPYEFISRVNFMYDELGRFASSILVDNCHEFAKLIFNGTVEHFFYNYYADNEGKPFARDKAIHTVECIIMHILYTSEKIYNFNNKLLSTPKTIENVDRAIEMFNKWWYNK